ncbi:MAG: ribosome-associated protein [Thermoproteota archaeon]|jgi:ribosome-associated protein
MITIPKSECMFTFSRSSGAGGQNVNKVNSKVTMRWDLDSSKACHAGVKRRFREKYSRYIVDGVVQMVSQRHRSQSMNIDDCISKLESCLNDVRELPKMRKATKPSRSSVKKRLDGKTKKSKLKKMRQEKF